MEKCENQKHEDQNLLYNTRFSLILLATLLSQSSLSSILSSKHPLPHALLLNLRQTLSSFFFLTAR